VKPLTVDITNPQTPLIADRRYEISCKTTGSRPNAIITWYKGKRQLKRTKVSIYENEKNENIIKAMKKNFLRLLIFFCNARFPHRTTSSRKKKFAILCKQLFIQY
jgi:hypothetical protein